MVVTNTEYKKPVAYKIGWNTYAMQSPAKVNSMHIIFGIKATGVSKPMSKRPQRGR